MNTIEMIIIGVCIVLLPILIGVCINTVLAYRERKEQERLKHWLITQCAENVRILRDTIQAMMTLYMEEHGHE